MPRESDNTLKKFFKLEKKKLPGIRAWLYDESHERTGTKKAFKDARNRAKKKKEGIFGLSEVEIWDLVDKKYIAAGQNVNESLNNVSYKVSDIADGHYPSDRVGSIHMIIRRFIEENYGKRVTIIYKKGKINHTGIFNKEEDINKFMSTLYKEGQSGNPEESIFFLHHFFGDLIMIPLQDFTYNIDSIVEQRFLDAGAGLHCVIDPIINRFSTDLENVTSVSAKKRYNGIIGYLNLKKIELSMGATEEDIQDISTRIGMTININLPMSLKKLINCKPGNGGTPRGQLDFLFTRLNHVDFVTSNVVKELSTHAELELVMNYLDADNKFYIYSRSCQGVSSLETIDGKFSVLTDFSKYDNEFIEETLLRYFRICDIKDYQLSKFVRNGLHYGGATWFKGQEYLDTIFVKVDGIQENLVYDELEDGYLSAVPEIEISPEVKSIDSEKCFANCHKSKYYEGYPSNMSQMVKTDKIIGTGLYLCRIISIPDNVILKKFLGEHVGITQIYPNPFITCFRDEGVIFEIYAAAIGERMDFSFEYESDLPMLDNKFNRVLITIPESETTTYEDIFKMTKEEQHNYINDPKYNFKIKDDGKLGKRHSTDMLYSKDDGVPFYSKHVGTQQMKHLSKTYLISNNYLKNNSLDYPSLLKEYGQYDDVQLFERNDYEKKTREIAVTHQKESNLHLSHVAAFIQMYMILGTFEQIKEMDEDKIIGVNCDQIIYMEHEFKLTGSFRFETKELNINKCRTGYYMTPPNEIETDLLEFIETLPVSNYEKLYDGLVEVKSGPGGSGKTEGTLTDVSIQRPAYVTIPHRLCADIKEKFPGIYTEVFANILKNDNYAQDPRHLSYITRNFNTILADECSQYTIGMFEELQDIFRYHKLIIAGDVGFQLGPIICYPKNVLEPLPSESLPLTLKYMKTIGAKINEFTTVYRQTDQKFNDLLQKDMRSQMAYYFDDINNIGYINDLKIKIKTLTPSLSSDSLCVLEHMMKFRPNKIEKSDGGFFENRYEYLEWATEEFKMDTDNDIKCIGYVNEILDSEFKRRLADRIITKNILEKISDRQITHEQLFADYSFEDMIICTTHEQKDYWTNNITNVEKYRVTKKTMLPDGTSIYNGTILAEKPSTKKSSTKKPVKDLYEYQHGFTIYSAQGMTMESNLYIDVSKNISAKLLYTALSRARRLDQIFLVKSPQINTNVSSSVL